MTERRRIVEEDLGLDRDQFFRDMIGDLAETLQDVVGPRDAKGFMAVVGAQMGDRLGRLYRDRLGKNELDTDEVSEALVDLKARIGGDFFVIERSDRKIVLGNRSCPFGDKVRGRPALCQMTSNVFGRIAAENLGYACVTIEEAIALGHAGCRVVIDLESEDADGSDGVEYFGQDRHG